MIAPFPTLSGPNVERGFHEELSGFLVEIDGFPSKKLYKN